MATKRRPRAVIYARVSEDRDGRSLSIDQQIEDCERYAKRNKLTVVGKEMDRDRSASSGKKRDGFEAAIECVRSGEADGILAWSSDRLYRRLIHPAVIARHSRRILVHIKETAADADLVLTAWQRLSTATPTAPG
ncbi:recombinase family protein [Flexivirga caeni]|uniref:Recombinase family protein n=1 Tax=Flexivirga caeni TaxID=2294115 RepID=A0A3M9MIZ6_9MICO|nr:recombinase family protein [Flexivirga caeni]RNI25137.1 recombinase family protein [Flexivirga caeni]